MTARRANVPERLERLADGVLLPCFDGTAAPEWVRRRVGGSLGGVCLFARNVQSVDQVRALSAALAAERESVVVEVARRAAESTGPLPELAEPVLVLRCSDIPNIAVGVVPWGPAAVMSPPPAEIVLRAGDAFPAERARAAGSLLVVTRDRHRHPWMVGVLAAARAVNRDAILLEMGISGVTGDDAPAIASYGGTLANSRAVSELLHVAPITA